jgi:APA family basic amino acid/polyamine antiporter
MSIVVGTVIGTGVFLKTDAMTRAGGSALWVLAAWAAAGVLSFTGAITYAELGVMFPRAGGEYVFLREAYSPLMGYFYAWNRFWIVTPGGIAGFALGGAAFIGDLVPYPKTVALTLIVLFTLINCLHVRAGGGVQTALTVVKVAMIAALAFGTCALARGGDWSRVADSGSGFPGATAFGAMVLSALWAYDGWNNLPMAAGEVRDPQRNLPRALVWGTLGVLAIYLAVNVGYFHALPLADVAAEGSTSVAQRAAVTFLGGTAQLVLAVAMATSAVSAMSGSMLTGARVPYAVARDGLAPAALARVHPRARVPIISVVVQSAVACVYVIGGGFDAVTDATMFASWLFYALSAGAVLVLRRRTPDASRAFRTPGYPVVPVVFIALSTALLVNTIYVQPLSCALGLGATALGGAAYAWTRNRKNAA